MNQLQRLLASVHVHSGFFALVFAPIALTLMGSSMADVQTMTALGQPLASVEGLIGMALASILLALVSISSDRSPAGMVVALVASLIIGALQLSGKLRVSFLMASSIDSTDMRAAMQWSLYPVIVSGILAGATAAFVLTLRAPRPPHSLSRPVGVIRDHPHTWVASLALPLCVVAWLILIDIAPMDTTEVAAQGMSGVLAHHSTEPESALFAAILLAAVAFISRWSLTGPQLVAWVVLVIPSYLLEPLWSSLTGHVVTPGASLTTQVAMSAPVATALGLVLATTTIGLYWARMGSTEETESGGDVTKESAADPRPAGK